MNDSVLLLIDTTGAQMWEESESDERLREVNKSKSNAGEADLVVKIIYAELRA